MENNYDSSLLSKEETNKFSFFISGLDYTCTAVTSFVLYWLFGKFTNDSNYYNGSACSKLLMTSQNLEQFYLYLFLTYLILFALNVLSFFNDSLKYLTQYTRIIVLLTTFFFGLFFLFKLTIDINLGEPCGELRCLALIVAVIGWIGICLFSCLLCITLLSIISKKD